MYLLCFLLNWIILSTGLILFDTSENINNHAATTDTQCGPVEGIWNESEFAYSFRGIPYVSPPNGTLRWKPPIALTPENKNCWTGTYQAKSFGSECFQKNDDGQLIGSEDCLFLNVWTPTLNKSANLSVMFYIHGGFLTTGNGNDQDIGYAPTPRLAKETNMVYVSINYRLQAFGFMALKWLADVSPTNTSGNYGLMDQIEGLNWVKQNIRNFGGNPDQVTVFGQSSGGTSIFALLASPLCQGLFHKAWSLSGSPILNKTATDAFKDNEIFINNTGCTNVDCLYALTASQVTLSVPWDVYPFWGMADQNSLPDKGLFDGALPIIDGYVLKEAPFDAWVHGRGVDVPTLIGTTAQETDLNPVPADVNKWTWSSGLYEAQVREKLGQFSNVIAETALKFYPSGVMTPEFQLTSMSSDLRMNCANDYLSLIAATSFRSKVFRYVANYFPSRPVYPFESAILSSYAFHGIDMFAFFGTMDKIVTFPTEFDRNWEANVRKEVLAFVHTGKPYSSTWRPYPDSTGLLSNTTSVEHAYHITECDFWFKNGFFSYAWIN